jgi:hypothetical protein
MTAIPKRDNAGPQMPASDNARPKRPHFQITRFDDVNQSVAKEYIVPGFLGAGEFSLYCRCGDVRQ